MKIVCIGGGPAGLYFGLLSKLRDPSHEVVVIERNRPYDTFGWGVVFSDQTLAGLRAADPVTAQAIDDAFNHWDDIEIWRGGRCLRSTGHGFCGIGRKRLLNILQDRCQALGVRLVFETDADDEAHADADLLIASDGLNSRIRQRYATTYQPDIDLRACRFVWLGTKRRFDAFTFDFQETPWGVFQAHAYRFDGDTSTFIVETPEPVWQAAGLGEMDKEASIAFCERLFADRLQGHALVSNAAHLRGSAQWIRFPRVICRQWVHWRDRAPMSGRAGKPGGRQPIVLMGDAAHTAHFSIGSGTKLAFEDAIDLDAALARHPGDLPAALAHYQATRSVEVLRIQNAARNSTEWFENVARYTALPDAQFAYSLLTRSQRISHENLRLRDPAFVATVEASLMATSAASLADANAVPTAADAPSTATSASPRTVPPMFLPLQVRGVVLPNRIVVSPMAQYSAVQGRVGDFHLAHLGARALGGAGLVMTEMTCVADDARITPGCPVLASEAQMQDWRRIVDFVHHASPARIGIQLGHAGPKGATCVPWQGGGDQPLPGTGQGDAAPWPLVAPSAQQYLPGVSAWARAMDRADMDRITAQFVHSTRLAAEAGFDWLELHAAHGYLLSAFLSPLTNRREDDYGGTLDQRLRWPLEVFAAVREAWPADRPISVRLSCHDWMPGGTTPDDAVAMARAFKAAGADFIDCSSGQVHPDQQPVYGRMYQTPFADRIRNEAGIRTIAVGAITEADQVNTILAAGRADLCALARPHLANPAWTLTEAARLGHAAQPWPPQYQSAKAPMERAFERERSLAAGQRQAESVLAV